MRTTSGAILAAVMTVGVAWMASADWTVDDRSLKDGAWRTDGLTRGRYYIHATVGENPYRLLHEGHVVDFTRGSAWRTEKGKSVMTVEAGPVEVGPGEMFRLGENSQIRSLTLSEKPLQFAPQKLFTNKGADLGSYFAISGVYSNGLFTAKVRNLVGTVRAAEVSVAVTDFYQRELGRAERKGVAIDGAAEISVPFRENTSGQYRATVKVRDERGRESFRVIPALRDAKTAFRELVRMNAGWTRKGRSVTMPSEITDPETRFELRRTIPASVAGRRLWICIQRLTGAADLYIDGKKAAAFGQDGNENGLEADVTDFIRPGEEQLFVFEARHYKSINRPAIGEVALEARPATALGDVRIETSYREKRIRVGVDCPAGCTFRNTIFAKDEKLISFAEEAKWENPPLWGPFEFPLLRLVTELIDAEGRVVDAKETRFGFREIWADGMAIMWNGHRVKGDARAFQSTWSSWSFDRRNKRQSNCDTVWFNKRVGVKFLRHIYNSSEFFDFCDEAGLLVAKGGFTVSGSSPDKDADEALWARKYLNDTRMIAALRHHPSIMAWYLSNEYRAHCTDSSAPRITAAVKNAIACDPTRFAEAGCDIDMRGASQIVSTHYPAELNALRGGDCFMPDCFYWRPVDKPFEKGMMVPCGQSKGVANITFESPIRWGEKPICINETCWDYFFAPPFGYTRLGCDDVFNGRSFLDKWHIETDVEAVRGHRDAEASLWTTWRHIGNDPIRRVSPEIDVVNIQRHHVFYAGAEVSYDVNAFYDVWRADRLTWFWQLEDAAGRAVVRGEDDRHEVDTSALFRKTIRFAAPERPGEFTLRFGFRGRCEKTLSLKVCEKKPLSRPGNVIAKSETLTTNLLTRAAAGETIVILAREDYPEWLPELPKVTQQSAAILRTFRPDHPVQNGISAEDLTYFNPKSIACFHGFSKPSAGNARTIIEFGGPSGLAYSALLEVPYGKGAFLYSRIVLGKQNPIAAKLLRNMSAYRRESAPGKALFLAGGSEALAKALRQRCGVVCEEGRAADAARYVAVMVDGSRVLAADERAALERCGRPVFVFNPSAQYGFKTRKVVVKAWQGRAVRVGRDPLTDGLTNQDLMWRAKYEDPKTASANLGSEEFDTEEGVLLYPAYAVRRGNFVFLTADPDVHHPSIDTLAKRFWATLFGNAGVAIRPFEKPRLPKNLFYTSLDLSQHLDRAITADEIDDDGKGSWMDQGKAQQLPMKFRHPTAWVGMVPYDVKKDGFGALALATENRKGGYSNVVLKVGRKIETVNWLWSSTWGAKGKRHYSVTLRYADGTEATVLGVGGVNVQDCFSKNPDLSEETDTITFWKDFRTPNPVFSVANVYSTTYVNPHPERKVESVEFVRGERRCARVGIFAVTVGERTGGYEKMPAAERAALHDSLVAEAQSAVQAKDDERAIAAYEKALRVRPEMLGIYRSLGAIYEAERDWESALVTYRRSLEAEYNQPDMWEAEKAMLKKLGRAK